MIQEISDTDLHQMVLTLRKNEKETVASLIEHLKEIKKRKVYSDFGCSSIHTYCVKILDYSDGEAWARVKTLELIEDMPALTSHLDKNLSLTNAAYLQQLFQIADYSEDKKEELVKKSLDKSTREVKAMLEQQAVNDHLKEESNLKSKRRKNHQVQSTKLTFHLSENEMEDLDFIKSKLKIKDDQELLKYLLKEKKEQLDPGAKVVRPINKKTTSKPRSISPLKKYQVYKMARSKCVNCGSVFNLNIDHIKPVGMGGTNDISNLRLLCHNCNIRAAIKVFGIDKMNKIRANQRA